LDSSIESAVRRFGRTAFSFDVLEASDRYAFHASQRVPGAFVPYRSVGGVDAVIGEPLAPEDRLAEVTREFLEARRGVGRRVVGFCASEAFARAAVEVGAAAAQITAEPEIDPVSYEPIGGSAKKLRAYARRLRRNGVQAVSLTAGASVPSEFSAPADALIGRWKRKAVPRAAHILELEPWRLAHEKRYFAVFDPKSPDRMWSLLIAHPVYALDGWHLCHLVRDPEAPKGVTELAVLTASSSSETRACATRPSAPTPCRGRASSWASGGGRSVWSAASTVSRPPPAAAAPRSSSIARCRRARGGRATS
jgi:hypothetical protein